MQICVPMFFLSKINLILTLTVPFIISTHEAPPCSPSGDPQQVSPRARLGRLWAGHPGPPRDPECGAYESLLKNTARLLVLRTLAHPPNTTGCSLEETNRHVPRWPSPQTARLLQSMGLLCLLPWSLGQCGRLPACSQGRQSPCPQVSGPIEGPASHTRGRGKRKAELQKKSTLFQHGRMEGCQERAYIMQISRSCSLRPRGPGMCIFCFVL